MHDMHGRLMLFVALSKALSRPSYKLTCRSGAGFCLLNPFKEYDYDVNLEPTDRVEAYYNADEGVDADEILDVAQLPLETETFGELRLPEPAIVKLQATLRTAARWTPWGGLYGNMCL